MWKSRRWSAGAECAGRSGGATGLSGVIEARNGTLGSSSPNPVLAGQVEHDYPTNLKPPVQPNSPNSSQKKYAKPLISLVFYNVLKSNSCFSSLRSFFLMPDQPVIKMPVPVLLR